MQIGDWLYRLNLKEERSAPVIQRPTLSQTVILNNVTVQAGFTVPDDMALLLQDFCCVAQGGGAQTVATQQVRIFADDGLNQTIHFLETTVGLAVASRTVVRTLNDIVLMPGEVLHALATFSAGAVNNTLVITAMGLFIPRGNLQLR